MSNLKFEGAMLIAVIAIGVGFLGWVLPGVSVHRISRTGTATCTVATSGTCTVTATYSSPLTSAPCTGCYSLTFVNPTVPGSTVQTQSYATFFAVESAGATWTSMPAAQTEIFGDTGQHWIIVDWTKQTSEAFCVNVLVGSNTMGATLNLQYSTDAGVTFTTLGAGILVDFSVTPGPFCESYSTIPVPARTASTILRIVGSGGGGVGDDPVFTLAYSRPQLIQSLITTIMAQFTAAPGASSAIIIIRMTAGVSQSETVSYQVYICSDGSSTC